VKYPWPLLALWYGGIAFAGAVVAVAAGALLFPSPELARLAAWGIAACLGLALFNVLCSAYFVWRSARNVGEASASLARARLHQLEGRARRDG